MKRFATVLCLLLVGAVLGASATRSFPYLSPQQNAPVTVTAFEWRAACSALRGSAKSLANHFPIANMEANPGQKGVFITCGTRTDAAVLKMSAEEQHAILSLALAEAVTDAEKRFLAPKGKMVLLLTTSIGQCAFVYGQEYFLDTSADGAARRKFAMDLGNAAK